MTPKIFVRSLLVLLSVSMLVNTCLGFVPGTPNSIAPRKAKNFIPTYGRSSLSFNDSKGVTALAVTPDIEAEVLTTMAHATMDFSAYFSPSKSLLRLLAVIGRVFAISADYVIDHTIRPEEMVIQLILMSIAIKELVIDKELVVETPANSKHIE